MGGQTPDIYEEVNKMQRKRRDNRTRMQRKVDQSTAIAALCLFACAVLAFCAGVCKITAPKLKAQESALKCEIEACEEIKEKEKLGKRLSKMEQQSEQPV